MDCQWIQSFILCSDFVRPPSAHQSTSGQFNIFTDSVVLLILGVAPYTAPAQALVLHMDGHALCHGTGRSFIVILRSEKGR
jgi:hypothetical protein